MTRLFLTIAFLFLGAAFLSVPVWAEETVEIEPTSEVSETPVETTTPIPEEEPAVTPEETTEEVTPSDETQPILQTTETDLDNDKIEELDQPVNKPTEDLTVQKAWTLGGAENVLGLRDWINQLGLTGRSVFEITFDNLSSGTFQTSLNGTPGSNLVLKNGKARFEIPIAWIAPGRDNMADTTFSPNWEGYREQHIDWGASQFTIHNVPVGSTYTIVELFTETNIGDVKWEVRSEYSDFFRPRLDSQGVAIPGSYTLVTGDSTIQGEVTNFDTNSVYQNMVTFINTKNVSFNVTIKKEVIGKQTDESFEILIIPYQWNDAKTRFNIAMVLSSDKLKAIDIGRDDYDELVDLEYFAKEMRYIYQLTIPDHGDKWYRYLESWFSQFEKKNDADAGYLAMYDYDLAKRFMDIVKRDFNGFFDAESEHFLNSVKNFENVYKAKGYESFGEYFMSFLMGFDTLSQEDVTEAEMEAYFDTWINDHREAGITKGDFAFIHMLGHMGFIYQDMWTGEVAGLEMWEFFEHYEEVRRLLTPITVKHGDTIDITEYLKYTDWTNMVIIYEKDYTHLGYKRAGVITNWVNLLDFTLEELLLGEGTVELTNVLENVYLLSEEPIKETPKPEQKPEEFVSPKPDVPEEEVKVSDPVTHSAGIQTGLENIASMYSMFAGLSLAGLAVIKNRKH